eukprot:TRINITY_DN1143_c5_g2_i1.p1 TRINITY_DN1143_c5_g2~~TRINITY_DN1143_c5_g2_i1.p1  ORF type:complete len:359 (+),score=122.65 TRINITY_DN1143_c5_g2_i1:34-1110(+)
MTLEATYICVDNSETMRNGDYSPTRLQAVSNACNVLAAQKTQVNPENGVGFLTMGNDRVRIVETLTPDLNRLLSSLTHITPGGSLDLVKGLQVCQLGLKHRMNKNQRQRIVAFVGSKVNSTEKELVTLAKKLKKHSVSVDIVCFGCEENVKLMQAFIDNVNSKQQDKDTSHLLVVKEGQSVADCLLSSPILNPDGTGGGGGGGSDAMFGVDPNLDPELAMVLRMSMEEERARQEKAKAESESKGGDADMPQAETQAAAAAPAVMNEDDDLARAIALSMQETQPATDEPVKETQPASMEVDGEEELTEEQQMELALKMSMQETADPELDALMGDEDLAAEVAAQLGVDASKEKDKANDK